MASNWRRFPAGRLAGGSLIKQNLYDSVQGIASGFWEAPAGSAAYTITAQSGIYNISGQSIGLSRNRNIAAQPGAYSLSGQGIGLSRNRTLAAQAGSYSYTGQAATVTYTPNAVGYTLTAQPGSYVLTGQSATLLRSKQITAQVGSYTVNGQAATLLRSKQITAQVGSYTVNGQAATLLRYRSLFAQHGSYAYVGKTAALTKTGMVWPLETDVRLGVQYGPTGTEYTGTLTGGGGNAILMRRR
jgi:hypothetical protein